MYALRAPAPAPAAAPGRTRALTQGLAALLVAAVCCAAAAWALRAHERAARLDLRDRAAALCGLMGALNAGACDEARPRRRRLARSPGCSLPCRRRPAACGPRAGVHGGLPGAAGGRAARRLGRRSGGRRGTARVARARGRVRGASSLADRGVRRGATPRRAGGCSCAVCAAGRPGWASTCARARRPRPLAAGVARCEPCGSICTNTSAARCLCLL